MTRRRRKVPQLPDPTDHSEQAEIARAQRRNVIRRARRRTTREPENGDWVVAKKLNYDCRNIWAERPDYPRRNVVGVLAISTPPADIELAWGPVTYHLVREDGDGQLIFVEPDTIRLLR